MSIAQDELPFAFFRHPDGRWYRIWMTRTQPRTQRGHPWHVHVSYDQGGSLAPVAGPQWHEAAYGMANWDFDDLEAALVAYRRRARDRAARGYSLVEGCVPAGPS